MSGSNIPDLIAQIENMKLEDLRTIWKKHYGRPPGLQSLPIMRMMLAWRLQSEELGGLDEATRRALAKSGLPEAEGKHLGDGARLTRKWKGRDVEVIVEENGFRWDNNVYSSLSAAATAIAGSRWNGPRFFGLRDQS